MIEVLTPNEMGEADQRTITAGVPGTVLMDAAGGAVAEEVMELVPPGSKILCLAGPGNNGGDGYVALRILRERGYTVSARSFTSVTELYGDAKWAFETSEVVPDNLEGDFEPDADLIIDALFGAGLGRPISGLCAEVIEKINASEIPVVSVDLPSGIDGSSGMALGCAIQADRTVTFFRLKPGHLLLPGRAHCGRVRVCQIGILDDVLAEISPRTFHNVPELWSQKFPGYELASHKYDHGHALVASGPMSKTGAARLAAEGALRGGAGLVTLASPPGALMVNASHLTAVMLQVMDGPDGLREILSDARFNALTIGPGLGIGSETRALVLAGLDCQPGVVLDADALTSFADDPDALWNAIRRRSAPTLLTPHDGEFARIFPDIGAPITMEPMPGKLERARLAAARSGATLILKGADTVVAAPDGRAAIASNAPAWLATAGSGDVLAGLACAAIAQHMPPFEAGALAVWLHGEAGNEAGPGLIAEDLPKAVSRVRKRLASTLGFNSVYQTV